MLQMIALRLVLGVSTGAVLEEDGYAGRWAAVVGGQGPVIAWFLHTRGHVDVLL